MNTLFKLVVGLVLLLGAAGTKAMLIVDNGSFETGDFTGWTTVTTGSPIRPWAVTGAGVGGGFGMATTSPQDGAFVAWNGFNGNGPMGFHMFQDVAIPNGSATLSWDYRAQWNFIPGGTASLPRVFTVDILDATTNALLSELYSFSTGTQATNPTGDTGWLTQSADISAFAGSTVRLRFLARIPQSATGPGQIEFDDISISVPEPASLAIVGLGLAGIGYQRRRMRTFRRT